MATDRDKEFSSYVRTHRGHLVRLARLLTGGDVEKSAPVTRTSSGWVAHVVNRSGAPVSLRATATDALGGKVEQTIKDAYLVR